MTTAATWIRQRLAEAPEDLLAVMTEAVAPFGELQPAEAMAKGASVLYSRVVEGTGGRDDALPLLAADALLTHAFEAQAELDPERLEALASAWTATELAGES